MAQVGRITFSLITGGPEKNLGKGDENRGVLFALLKIALVLADNLI